MNETEKMKARSDALNNMEHAGFWIRFGAWFVDTFILGFLIGIPNAMLQRMVVGETPPSVSHMVVSGLFTWGIYFLYSAGFTSQKGGTPGKLLFKLRVIDLNTIRYPTFGHALLRALSHYISAIPLFIGYFIVLFRSDKRALHDLMVHTVVIRLQKK